MAQRKINAVNTHRFQASLLLVGLFWLACATLAQAAGNHVPGRAKLATNSSVHPGNATRATAATGSSGILLYNPINGAATYGTLYADGHFLATANFPPNAAASGWSHHCASQRAALLVPAN